MRLESGAYSVGWELPRLPSLCHRRGGVDFGNAPPRDIIHQRTDSRMFVRSRRWRRSEPELLKPFAMGELGDLSPFGRRRLFGRKTQRDQRNQFEPFRDFQDGLGSVMVKESHDDCSQTEVPGCQTKALGGDSEIVQEPVPEFGRDLAFVIP